MFKHICELILCSGIILVFIGATASAEECKRKEDVYLLVTFPEGASEQTIQQKQNQEIDDAKGEANDVCGRVGGCLSGKACKSVGSISVAGGSSDSVPLNTEFEKNGTRYTVIGAIKPWGDTQISPADQHTHWKKEPAGNPNMKEWGRIIKLNSQCDCVDN